MTETTIPFAWWQPVSILLFLGGGMCIFIAAIEGLDKARNWKRLYNKSYCSGWIDCMLFRQNHSDDEAQKHAKYLVDLCDPRDTEI